MLGPGLLEWGLCRRGGAECWAVVAFVPCPLEVLRRALCALGKGSDVLAWGWRWLDKELWCGSRLGTRGLRQGRAVLGFKQEACELR